SIWASWDTGGRDDRATGTVAWGRRGPTVACPRHSVGRPAMLQGDGPTSPRPAATNHNLERNRLNPDALNDICGGRPRPSHHLIDTRTPGKEPRGVPVHHPLRGGRDRSRGASGRARQPPDQLHAPAV